MRERGISLALQEIKYKKSPWAKRGVEAIAPTTVMMALHSPLSPKKKKKKKRGKTPPKSPGTPRSQKKEDGSRAERATSKSPSRVTKRAAASPVPGPSPKKKKDKTPRKSPDVRAKSPRTPAAAREAVRAKTPEPKEPPAAQRGAAPIPGQKKRKRRTRKKPQKKAKTPPKSPGTPRSQKKEDSLRAQSTKPKEPAAAQRGATPIPGKKKRKRRARKRPQKKAKTPPKSPGTPRSQKKEDSSRAERATSKSPSRVTKRAAASPVPGPSREKKKTPLKPWETPRAENRKRYAKPKKLFRLSGEAVGGEQRRNKDFIVHLRRPDPRRNGRMGLMKSFMSGEELDFEKKKAKKISKRDVSFALPQKVSAEVVDFSHCVKMLLPLVHTNFSFQPKAAEVVSNFLSLVLGSLVDFTCGLSLRSKSPGGKGVSSTHGQDAIRKLFPPELSSHALSEGARTVFKSAVT